MPSSEIPPELRPILTRFAADLDEALDGDLVGLHVVGSWALGGGDAHSDLDVLVATRDDLDDDAIGRLGALHDALPSAGLPFADHVEGSYAPVADLARARGARPWLYVDNGSRELVRSRHDDTIHARWILREHGIAVTGLPARTLVPAIDADALRAEAVETLERWSAETAADPSFYDDEYRRVSHVLAVCRVLVTRRTGTVVGKAEAASRAARELPPEWRDLIEHATRERRAGLVPGRPSDPERARRTRAFQEWAARRGAPSDPAAE